MSPVGMYGKGHVRLRLRSWRGTVLCLLLVGPLLSYSCASQETGQEIDRLAKARIVYQGKIEGVSTLESGSGREVAVWVREATASQQQSPGRAQETGAEALDLLRLNVVSGRAKLVRRGVVSPQAPMILPFWMALSQTGRRLAAALSEHAAQPGSVIYVSERFEQWIPVTPDDGCSRIQPEWSPDGEKLAFLSVDATKPQATLEMQAMVVGLAPRADRGEAVGITPPGARSVDLAWDVNSQHVYHIVQRGSKYVLEIVKWPSLERTVAMEGPAMGLLSVAASTGDVVWLQQRSDEASDGRGADGRTWVLWKLSPGHRARETPVRLDFTPSLVSTISPDGKWWVVAPRAEDDLVGRTGGLGIVLYSVKYGTRYRCTELEGKKVVSLGWARGGRTLLVAERAKSVWLVETPRTE